MKKVGLITHLPGVAEIFRDATPAGFEVVSLLNSASCDEKIAALQGCESLVQHPSTLSGRILRECRSLKLLQLLTAGFDKIDLKLASDLGVAVANNGGANAWSVAEHTIGMLLSLYRRLGESDASVRAGTWKKPVSGFNTYEVSGKTVGIVGAGKIGRKVAERLHAFETKILYFDVVQSREMEERLQARRVSFEELLHQADILSLHLPLTPGNVGLIGREALAAMKPNAVLLNAARGELVDEAALAEALRAGRIAGAGLDVFCQEPVSPESPLLRLDNVVLSPHSAGYSYEGWFRRCQFAWENIQKVASGGTPGGLAR